MTDHVWDIVAAGGVLLVAWGLYCIYPPAALLALGLFAIAFALVGSRYWK